MDVLIGAGGRKGMTRRKSFLLPLGWVHVSGGTVDCVVLVRFCFRRDLGVSKGNNSASR